MNGAKTRVVGVDVCKTLAILCVLLIHTSGDVLTACAPGSKSFLEALIWSAPARCAVPLFLLCSGALLLDGGRELPLKRLWGRNIPHLLLALFFATGHRFTFMHHKRDLLFISLSGVTMAVEWLLLFEAYAQIGVSLGMLINYTGPALVILFSPLFLKERITFPKIIALAAALLGAFFISGQAAAHGVSAWGLLCAILSAVTYAIMVLTNKLAQSIKGIENAVLQLLRAAAVVAVFVGCKQGFSMDIAAGEWLPILWLGFVNTGLGCYFYFSSIGALPAQSVAICGYLEPLFAVVLSVLILKETMSPLQIIGAVLIVGGAVFGECCRGRKGR